MDGLKGLDELVATLKTIKDRGVKKAAKAGVNAGLAVLAKAMRQAINSSPASPQMKKEARATIGKRLKKATGDDYVGKAGFAVGKPSKRKQEKAKARAGSSRGGVGISASNIHWPTLGTKARQTKTGHKTGAMPADLSGVISGAAASAGPAMLNAARAKVSQVLAAEAAKARKG